MKEVNNENFSALLEEYLDSELIKEKIEIEESNNNNIYLLSDSPFCIDDAISINDFVNNYLNIHTDARDLYHCGLKELMCPYVVGVSNDFANKNPEYVKFGFLLIVIDAHNNRGTYLNPFYLHKILNKEKTEDDLKKIRKRKINNLKNIRSFISEYLILKSMVETNNEFYNILKSQKKLKNIREIKLYERIGEKNDKYKRK